MLRTTGRAARGEYWAMALLWLIVLTAAGISVAAAPENYKAAGLVAYIVLFFAAFVAFRRLAIRRAHDLGNSAPSMLRPAIGLGLLFRRGKGGHNEYGPEPTWQAAAVAWTLVIGAWVILIKAVPMLSRG